MARNHTFHVRVESELADWVLGKAVREARTTPSVVRQALMVLREQEEEGLRPSAEALPHEANREVRREALEGELGDEVAV